MAPQDHSERSRRRTTDDDAAPEAAFVPIPVLPEVPVSRLPLLAASAAAGLYAAVGILELAFGQETVFTSPVEYVIEWLFVGALGAAVTFLVAGARSATDRLTAVSFGAAAAGHIAMGIAAVATAIAGRESLDVLFPLGVLLGGIGLLALAVQDLRRRVEPWRAGLVLAAAFVLAIPADALAGSGSLVLAAGWSAMTRLLATSTARTPVAVG
jgi:hypothetical protein